MSITDLGMKWVCTSTIPGIPSSCQICLTGAGSKADSDICLSISIDWNGVSGAPEYTPMGYLPWGARRCYVGTVDTPRGYRKEWTNVIDGNLRLESQGRLVRCVQLQAAMPM
ncbi:Uncharacterised protein [Mycobacteroides abscessus subsp. abscessus]|nr:Uncharacterised protein [Mycobacteroides abscessus subsp. abscessus]